MGEGGEEKNADLEELEKQKWYHGLLPRKDIVELLNRLDMELDRRDKELDRRDKELNPVTPDKTE